MFAREEEEIFFTKLRQKETEAIPKGFTGMSGQQKEVLKETWLEMLDEMRDSTLLMLEDGELSEIDLKKSVVNILALNINIRRKDILGDIKTRMRDIAKELTLKLASFVRSKSKLVSVLRKYQAKITDTILVAYKSPRNKDKMLAKAFRLIDFNDFRDNLKKNKVKADSPLKEDIFYVLENEKSDKSSSKSRAKQKSAAKVTRKSPARKSPARKSPARKSPARKSPARRSPARRPKSLTANQKNILKRIQVDTDALNRKFARSANLKDFDGIKETNAVKNLRRISRLKGLKYEINQRINFYEKMNYKPAEDFARRLAKDRDGLIALIEKLKN